MTPAEAARILELPPDAAPDAIESRFIELRAKLEEKIGKAPTPGLREKYRGSLTQITEAFETMTLAADSSSLPVLQRREPAPAPARNHVAAEKSPGQPPAASSSAARARAKQKKSSSREFVVVTILAVLLLGFGTRFVLNRRAEQAEKRRQAAEAKAESERLAALAKQIEEEKTRRAAARAAADAKAEKEHQDALLVQLRTRMKELDVVYQAVMRVEATTQRQLNEAKSAERDASRQANGKASFALTSAGNKVKALTMYADWLEEYLPKHPARIARAKAEELISARAADDAVAVVDAYATALDELQQELKKDHANPAMVAGLTRHLAAANKGDVKAMEWLGSVYYDGNGIPPDPAKGVEWLNQAAEKDSAEAIHLLAEAYEAGRGVAADPARAFALHRRAAELGNRSSMFSVAYLSDIGRGTPKDIPNAIAWYTKAAEKDDTTAMYNLSIIYENGDGVPKDLALAAEWDRKAAEKGRADNMTRLGQRYLAGNGVPANEATGLEWLRKAARENDSVAQNLLRKKNLTW